jgi:hypothetical protein
VLVGHRERVAVDPVAGPELALEIGRPQVIGGSVETITWVSFNFDPSGRPVLPLLEEALKATRQVVAELSSK